MVGVTALSAATRTPSCSSRWGRVVLPLLQIAEAKTVCRRCPVVSDCPGLGARQWQDAGVWGGKMSEDERRALKPATRVPRVSHRLSPSRSTRPA